MSQLTITAPASRYTVGRDLDGRTYGSNPRGQRRSRDVVTADITTLLASAEHGDRAAADAVFTALYEELHRMARRELASRGAGVTLGATTLLHDAYLDISGREGTAFPDRNRFMGYASRVMRGIIIDYARSHQAQKRGGQFEITSLETDVADVVADAGRADADQRRARRAGRGRRPAGADRRPQVLLRLLVRRDRRHARACRSAPCSATGRRRASTCISGCVRSRGRRLSMKALRQRPLAAREPSSRSRARSARRASATPASTRSAREDPDIATDVAGDARRSIAS